MTKDVLVSISGLSFMEGEHDATPVEFITGGNYYKKNNSHYVLFDEISEDSPEITKNVLKLRNDKIELTKKGSNNVHMVFERNHKNHTYYNTPFGNLLLAIMANNINIAEEEEEINVNIDYLLEANYEAIADCQIKIKITSKDKKDFFS